MLNELLMQPEIYIQNHSGYVSALKKALIDAKEELARAFHKNEDTSYLIRQYSDFIDRVLILTWDQFKWSENKNSWRKSRISLIAVGGYGRRELLPHSDIDILILLERNDAYRNKSNIESFVTLLWDIGLKIGHSVRSLKDCKAQAFADVTILTAMTEARLIRGEGALLSKLEAIISPQKIWDAKQFFIAKNNEQILRHEKSDYTERSLQPNVKTSPGGLRDIQTLLWIAKRIYEANDFQELVELNVISCQEYETLINSRNFLWKVRFGLHLITGRDENRLMFAHQQTLAENMRYEDKEQLAVEQFMQHYYLSVTRINTINETLLQHFEEVIWKSKKKRKGKKLNARFNLINHLIEVSSPFVFEETPEALFEMFLLAASDDKIKGFTASTIRLAQKYVYLIDEAFRRNKKNSELFLKILGSQHHLFTQLRRMGRWGILGAYLPEFDRVIGQMQFDLFHIYTVDAHTLQVVRNMRRFRYKNNEQKFPIAAHIHARLPKIELLYIAGFYHDLGKGLKGDHSNIGSDIARGFCERHSLPQWDTNLVCWLVEKHLVMSTTAQRRDIQDPQVIHEFAELVGDQIRLEYLYALTVADMNATNSNLWNGWIASLMNQLYLETKKALRRGVEKPIDRTEYLDDVREQALKKLENDFVERSKVESLWTQVDEEYFLKERVIDIVWQTKEILEQKNLNNPVVLVRDDKSQASNSGYTQIFVHTKNRKDLFTSIIQAIDKLRLSIVDARIATSKNDMTFNTFTVLEQNGLPVGKNPSRVERITNDIRESIETKKISRAYSNGRTYNTDQFKNETIINIIPQKDENVSVLEITTGDRPGVLVIIAEIFNRFDINLVSARITTLGEKVEDIFYITPLNRKGKLKNSILVQLKAMLLSSLDAREKEIAG
ncbi:MAG: [protein-PII] uridylyltransferase [Gammaproteobacteria bacterium]|nr:[protein-PII] uridylyltransferase [Gammaproteobacteria bacterium]